MGSKCNSSYMISFSYLFKKMSTNVASGDIRFSVKLAVFFSYLSQLDIRRNSEFFGIKQ